MSTILPLSQVEPRHKPRVGGKCSALARMARGSTESTDGIRVPETLCITAQAYRDYVAATGLRERIMLELGRKDFEDMRWEELWDASLRIRNLFLRTPIPDDLAEPLTDALDARFRREAVAVRSSAPGEDSETVSFAGLHESFINVSGVERILEHVRLVWASLWSDAALLYRQDLGLDVSESTMAIVVQELVTGDRSGVAFSQNPNDASQAVIESVYGLNQGLVDGTVEPDQWVVDRDTGDVVSHQAPPREQRLVPGPEGVHLEPLPEDLSGKPPLSTADVTEVFETARQLEAVFGRPQDVEWTWGSEGLVVLQSRPITTPASGDPDDERRWYLSLRRSFENLQSLRQRIEEELIPAMIEEADTLAGQAVDHLSDEELAAEIDRRQEIYDGWVDVYWDEFIPFAHGIRLFGQVYNDALHPDDPYAFMDLLAGTEMASLARNRALEEMAATIREHPQLSGALRARLTNNVREPLTNNVRANNVREPLAHGGDAEIDEAFQERMDEFVDWFGDLSCAMTGGARCGGASDALIRILLEMASSAPAATSAREEGRRSRTAMRDEFLDQFEGEEREWAAELLDLARTSYQLRDDDNIYLGRIEAEVLVAVEEGRRRLEERDAPATDSYDVGAWGPADVARALRDPDFVPERSSEEESTEDFVIQARQLIGQPAGPGVAHGPARVITSQADLTAFQHGEILVCDAVDPNMTFVVPLAAAVVERRGGMLIHGAIIAREYGLPCVTGVPDATSSIRTGDILTVDGHLGIVTLRERRESPAEDGSV